MLKNSLRIIRDRYVKNQAGKVKIPKFSEAQNVRYHLIFRGRVQGVGFRLSMYELAQRLEISGWVRNLMDFTVEAEVQGNEEKIEFLLESMEKLPQASVKNIEKRKLPLVKNEMKFLIIRE